MLVLESMLVAFVIISGSGNGVFGGGGGDPWSVRIPLAVYRALVLGRRMPAAVIVLWPHL